MLIETEKIKRVFVLLFTLFIVVVFPQSIRAQYTDSVVVSTPEYVPVITQEDTSIMFYTPPIYTSVLEKEHSPGRATLYSTFLPGLGQIYNKHYWKLPIIYGGAAAVTYLAITNRGKAQDYKQEYIRRDKGEAPNLLPNYPDESILNLYNDYQKSFELSIVVGSILYLVNILDAYVFAHLFSFTINDDLTMYLAPQINHTPAIPYSTPSLGIKWNISF